MRVFVCGDTHGDLDADKITRFKQVMGNDLTADDYLIICGDFGAVWSGYPHDDYLLDVVYGDFPCTVLWVDGNHENFDLLKEYPIEDWKGGRIHRIRNNIFHLMRGEVFLIEGKKFFTFGGAKSIDRGYATGDNKWWWAEELPSEQEKGNARVNLLRHGNAVDFVIAHNCPGSQIIPMFLYPVYHPDALTDFLDEISAGIKFNRWFFGHHHQDITFGKYTCLYNSIKEIKL